jgi:hypothetical protein
MQGLIGGVGKTAVILASFLCLLGLSQLMFMAFPSGFWSFIAFVIYGAYICAMAKFTPVSFLLLLPYIFFRATTMASGVAIECGGYMKDLEALGEPTGAYLRLAAIYIIFTSCASAIIEWVYPKIKARSASLESVSKRTMTHPWVWIFYGLFIAFSFYVLAIGAMKGFPLLNDIDRLTYRDEIGGRGFLLYMGNRMLAAYLFGIIIYMCVGMKRLLAIGLFLLMILISVLFGEKFTSLMLIAMYVVTPAYLMNLALQKRILNHIIPAVLAVGLLTMPIILAVYGWSDHPEQAVERLTNRMVGQGELWYVADRDTDDAFVFDTEHISYIVSSTVSLDADEMVNQPPFMGAMYFMHEYMTPGLLSLFLEKSSLTLTFGFEPYLLVVFGWIGMIFPLCFYACLYALGLLYLAWAVLNSRPISIFFAGKILIWMVVGLAQGYLFLILGAKLLILVAIVIAYELFSSLLSRQRMREYI